MIDRDYSALQALIESELPPLAYMGLWEYGVTSVNADGSVNGEPTTDLVPLPSLNMVPARSLAIGGVGTPKVGTLFLVEFRNIDGRSYGFVSVDAVAQTATVDATDTVSVGPTAANPVALGPASAEVARAGDAAFVYWPVGLLNGTFAPTGGSPTPLVNFPCQVLTPAPCLICYGNDRVLS